MSKKKINNLEVRNYTVELRALSDETRTIHGLAIPFNFRSELLSDYNGNRFYEYILPEALSEEFIESQDIKLYLNHDSSQGTYGRSKYGKGTLLLSITERGLEFETDAPKTVFGDALLEGIRRGDFDAISFAFAPKDEYVERNEDGTYNRYIRSFELIDEVSILSMLPAYSATDVNVRSVQEFIDEEEEKRKEEINKRLDARMEEINSSLADLNISC